MSEKIISKVGARNEEEKQSGQTPQPAPKKEDAKPRGC